MQGQSAGENDIGTCCVNAEQFGRVKRVLYLEALQSPVRTASNFNCCTAVSSGLKDEDGCVELGEMCLTKAGEAVRGVENIQTNNGL
jgi:hypothetical protein